MGQPPSRRRTDTSCSDVKNRFTAHIENAQRSRLRWGNRQYESESLPCSLWTQLATVEAGGWTAANVEEAIIPASLALDSGIWVPVAVGIHCEGLVVEKAASREGRS